jgi:hypothetical protein
MDKVGVDGAIFVSPFSDRPPRGGPGRMLV